jgi:hypothetical protein
MSYENLPIDIINHILLYTGVIKFRNGKYIDQIPKTDERYRFLDSIPRYRLYDFHDNTYGLFVWIQKNPIYRNPRYRFLNITVDFENQRIEYCYHKLLHSNRNASNVKFICPISREAGEP